MKAIWFNSLGDIYGELSGEDMLERIATEWNVLMPGDTISFVEDEDEEN